MLQMAAAADREPTIGFQVGWLGWRDLCKSKSRSMSTRAEALPYIVAVRKAPQDNGLMRPHFLAAAATRARYVRRETREVLARIDTDPACQAE
jgi:hypothetical protein